MQRMHTKYGSKLSTLLLGGLAALVVVSIILFPDRAFQSSLEGLTIWWKLVFPALLPFFILTELFIGFGVLQGLGVLLEPIMRKLFRLPGVSGWALASGLIVGFPSGARITASLREKRLLSRLETERLTALTHLCSPLFLIMVVGVGFLHSARLGAILAIVHYVAAILTGLLTRHKTDKSREDAPAAPGEQPESEADRLPLKLQTASIWLRALYTMRNAHLHDGRTFGKLLGDSVITSVQALMLIGGYMMIFSVLINVISIIHLTHTLSFVTDYLLSFMNLTTDTAPQWIKGILEIHLGAYAFSQIEDLPLLPQLSLLSAFLGWGGLSAHAQVAGLHQKTDARYVAFFVARIVHALLAFALTIVLWKPLSFLLRNDQPSFLWLDTSGSGKTARAFPLNGEAAWGLWGPVTSQLLLLLSAMLIVSLLIQAFGRRKQH
ncbi:nucleoside recognition domain-containing protein [Paenibacillus aestuarii]|uniref:Nucleoside recognition domain-containing protein n=1 Tax=Paenibacillus aestuarii TaxID=516965 RepID=A0ABW0K5I9_9BACL|nr:nucleoside recognition domain-containing protein [Paenibacillus aestuarii]